MASKLVTNGVRKAGQQLFLRRFKGTVAVTQAEKCAIPTTEVTTLNNGLRVASEDWDSPVTSVGVWLDVGSRFENDNNSGVSHFLEHVAFKGTGKHSGSQIEAEAEKRGVRFGATTSREMTSFTARCLRSELPWAMEVLSEVVKNSNFDDAVVDNERETILREMAEVESNYQEVVMDYLHATAYQGTPLSRTILGSVENVKSLKAKDLHNFADSLYKAPRMIVSCAGGVSHGEVAELANKHFGDVSATYEREIPRLAACRYTGSEIRDRDDALPLVHFALAVEGPGWASTDTIPLMVAKTLLGEWDNSHGGYIYTASKLARGFVSTGVIHNFEHFFHCYHDTSLWGVYLDSEKLEVDRCVEFILGEWMRICTSATDFEVQRAKNALKMSILMRLDGNTEAASDAIGRHFLAYGRRIPVLELLALIDDVTAPRMRDVCMKYIYDRCPVISSIGPVEAVPDYNRIRGNMWWIRF